MKEFEKLWEKNHPVYDTGADTVGHYNTAEEYWKAALKCVRDKMLSDCDEPYEPMEIYAFIGKELKVK